MAPCSRLFIKMITRVDAELLKMFSCLISTVVTELKIIRQPLPYGAVVDEKVTFTVAASSQNKLTFKWKLNGKTINQDDDDIKQTESPDGKSSAIEMKFSPTKHAGMYKCVVKDKKKGDKLSSNEVELKGELHNKSND